MAENARFGREKRVQSRRDFLRIQSSGRKYRSKHFLLALQPASDRPNTRKRAPESGRIGITVTTKVNKNAVARNKLKRRIREIYRRSYTKLTHPVDAVIIAFVGATELGFEEVREELCFLAERARLLRRGEC